MLARAAFLFLFLAPTLGFAEASNCPVALFEPLRKLKAGAQGLVGGSWQCSTLTPQNIKTFECRSNVKNMGRALTTSDDLNGIALGMFFQSLASNSHRQANCRITVLDKYAKDPNAQAQLNAKAEEAFNKIHEKLKSLVVKRNELQSNLNRMNIDAAADRAMSRMTYEGREQHKKLIEETSIKIAKLLTAVPLGYDPDVGRTLIQMSLNSRFDAGLFKAGLAAAAPKYQETSDYYRNKFTPATKDRGSYCLGLDYRNLAGKSGQVAEWLNTLPDETPGDRNLKQKLSCRLDAVYETGNKRFSNGVMYAGFLTYLLPPAWIPRAGGAVIGGVELALRGGAAVVAALSMDAMRTQCFPPTGMISGDGQACDPEKEFAHVLQESDKTKCAGMVLMSASLVGEARGVTQAVQAARASRAAARPAASTAQAAAIAPIANASDVGEKLAKSSQFMFVKSGSGQVPITKTTFTPGKSYVTLEHNGKIAIGEDVVGLYGTTRGSHLAMRQILTGKPITDRAPFRGGAIRVNRDGSIDVSGYHGRGTDVAATKEAARVLVEKLKAAMPGVRIRSTPDRLSTLPTK